MKHVFHFLFWWVGRKIPNVHIHIDIFPDFFEKRKSELVSTKKRFCLNIAEMKDFLFYQGKSYGMCDHADQC